LKLAHATGTWKYKYGPDIIRIEEVIMATTVETYYTGDTVRFSATFRDYPDDPEAEPETGDLLDPSAVTVSIYDADFVVIQTGTGNNESTGVYTYDFTMPDTPGPYYIEWKGIVNTKPEIKRDKFKVKFNI
jgi:uncharacterized protein YfaS (alpha-2-macroglobulin family)